MKAILKNLGCKVNSYETEYVRSVLLNNGYEIVEEGADVVIVNTCTVTNTSDVKSKKMIRRLKRENPRAIMVVMGCMIEYEKDNLSDIEADIYIGNKEKSKIINLIEEFKKNNKPIKRFYDLTNTEFEDMKLEKFETKTRGFVKIQDGCENFCSYCVIPYVRGSIRSKKKEIVLEEITDLVSHGHKEIVLTGIHTGKYNDDGYTLSMLIKEILEIKGLERLRLSSIEITEIDDELLSIYKENKKLSSHFHIPLQSGSDNVLKSMNRLYDTNYFLDLVSKLRSIREDTSITTDLIVGFPSETLEDFNDSYEFCKKVNFAKIHVFPFSLRSGTKACEIENIVSDAEKKRRVKEMLLLSKEMENDFINKNLNKVLDVIVENKKGDYYIAHTSNFIKVYLENVSVGDTINVKLQTPYLDGVKGKIDL